MINYNNIKKLIKNGTEEDFNKTIKGIENIEQRLIDTLNENRKLVNSNKELNEEIDELNWMIETGEVGGY